MPRSSRNFQVVSTKQFGGLDTSDRLPGGSSCSRHIASVQFNDNGVDEDITISRRYTTNTSDDYTGDDNVSDSDTKTTQDINPFEGYIEEAITFPQSTHSWLFTESFFSLPFAFAVGMVSLSYISLILALLNVFEEGEPGNSFGVPEQVQPSVRIAQYLAMIIALIMEEEIPTGLYLLRLITKKSLHNTFPRMKFSRFVAAAIVRLVMGYLFLFNTFCVVVQATAVLDIFFDVLALQFLQQLDDISFNLSKIDVFGRRMKKAALSKCFCAEFERQPFSKRKKVGIFLKGIYFLNLCALLFGMGYINYNQNRGVYYSDSLSVTYGEQIWNAAIINGIEEPRALLFSYFNGEYRRNETLGLHDGRPIYTEISKFVNGEPFTTTVGAQIKYCNSERAWVLAHDLIKKSDIEDESDCPWLLRSQETTEYNLLNVDGDWSIWTGNLQENGHFFAVDNECNGPADCNYHGVCNDGKCECSEEAGYYGIHCEHQKACRIIRGGKGEGGLWASVQWATDEMLIYQRPVYAYQGGLPAETLEAFNVDPDKDQVFLVYTGSRWLGVHFIGTKRNSPSRDFWRGYVQNFHAFWTNLYTTQTLFASDPTSKSSIIGIDFYSLGELGEEHGPYGELFPLSNPPGSGFFKCVDGEVEALAYEFSYLRHNYLQNRDEIVVEYEIKDGEKTRGREYQFKDLALDCASPIGGIILNPTYNRMIDKWPGWSQMNLIYNIDKSKLSNTTNIYNVTTGMLSWCVAVQLIESNSTKVLMEELNIIRNLI